jgi:hypothetical protein
MDPITQALLAVTAADDGDTTAAQAHITEAHLHARRAARRQRQIVEIAALVVAGARARAAGLVLEHTTEFPTDVDLLAGVADATTPSPPGG